MSSEHPHFHVEPSGASDESLQQVHDRLQHRKPEKPDGYSRFPLVILGVMCMAIYLGSLYLAHYSAHFDGSVYNENQPPGKASAAAAPEITPAMLGKRVFLANCIACHQVTGQGVPAVFPPLAGSDWAQGPEERVIRIVLHGLSGPVSVSGKDFNNIMTPFNSILKDEQIAQVLSYVRSEWGNNAPAVTPEAVAKIRAETSARTTQWTATELMAIGAKK
ncbi:MAG: c-type cytochrome [Opitutales bacterium]